jgi:hypothetical protein
MDYVNGKIYKITGSGLTYYGSTTQALSKRLYHHKLHLKCSSKQIIELGNYDICLVELFPCKTKEELHMRERFYIENNDCINKYSPIRTQIEIKEQKTQYRIDNADKIKEQTKQYYIDNKEKQKQYELDNADKIRERKIQYRIDNAEKLKEQKKQYRIDNADKIKEKNRQYYLKKKESLA